MLKYLWTVTQDLFVTVTLVTWMHAVLGGMFGRRGRVFHGVGLGLAVAASAALAAVKGTTNRIVSSHWNHYIYAFILALTLATIILGVVNGGRKGARGGAAGVLMRVAGTGLSAALVFYALPGVMLYPFNFNTMGNGYWSSYYMVRMAGWLLALLLLIAYSRMLYECACHIKPLGSVVRLMSAGALVNALYCFGRFCYAKFADEKLDPAILAGTATVDITGILTIYDGAAQFTLTDEPSLSVKKN